jgi:hypothetical protein
MTPSIFFDDTDKVDDRAPWDRREISLPVAKVIALDFISNPKFDGDPLSINAHVSGRSARVDVPNLDGIPRIPQLIATAGPINRSMDGLRANWIEIAL